jgi:ribosomal protein L23
MNTYKNLIKLTVAYKNIEKSIEKLEQKIFTARVTKKGNIIQMEDELVALYNVQSKLIDVINVCED